MEEEEYYDPPTFLTTELVAEIMAEFEWPASYILEDSGLMVEVKFPRCTLFIQEGFDSDLELRFSTADTHTRYSLSITHALTYLVPEAEMNPDFKPPKLDTNIGIFPTLQKVESGTRNLCLLMQAYLLPCIKGDFGWVDKLKEDVKGTPTYDTMFFE
ncbi:hypothetical protein [Chitinophaga sp. HK235]|uniref:hypothetical protein n=1 Tax=Chitinophaga sp. HK235 TaxID=2952571 RepID=UPI001BAC88F3|nr:hypothetical protein [Chitinophaga sp. HK235]